MDVNELRECMIQHYEAFAKWPDGIWIGFEAYKDLLRDSEWHEIWFTGREWKFRNIPVIPCSTIGLDEFTFIPQKEAETNG